MAFTATPLTMSTGALPEGAVSGQVGEMKLRAPSPVWDRPQVIRFLLFQLLLQVTNASINLLKAKAPLRKVVGKQVPTGEYGKRGWGGGGPDFS